MTHSNPLLVSVLLLFSTFALGVPSFIDANDDKDVLFATGNKGWVLYKGRYGVLPGEAISPRYYGGGVSERDRSRTPALICNDTGVWFFNPVRTKSYPGGIWNQDQSLGYPIYCKMAPDGSWFTYDGIHITSFNGVRRKQWLFTTTAKIYDIIPVEEKLFVLTDEALHLLDWEGDPRGWSLPAAGFDPNEVGKLSKSEVMVISPWRAITAQLPGSADGDIQWDPVPVSLCSAGGCSLNRISNGEWFIWGFWGATQGQGKDWQRLSPPIMGRENDTHIIGLAPKGDFFFALGAGDSDWGSTSPLRLTDYINLAQKWHVDGYLETDQKTLQSNSWWRDAGGFIALEKTLSTHPQLSGVAVGVVDTGIDTDHIVFSNWLLENEWQDGHDSDGNGFADDRFGYSFAKDSVDLRDTHGHGTHVSGLISCKNCGEGAALSNNAKIVHMAAINILEGIGTVDIARGIEYAIQNNVRILNLSFGGGPQSIAFETVIKKAVDAGILIFTSAGNANINLDRSPQMPGALRGVYNIGAIGPGGKPTSYSNHGENNLFLFAPGDKIYSSLPNNRWGVMSGTSMAAPLVTRGAAILWGEILRRNIAISPIDQRNLVRLALCQGGKKLTARKKSKCGTLDIAASFQWLKKYLDETF